jgi:phage tail tape-measure protein
MNKVLVAAVSAASLSLGACSTASDPTTAGVTTGAGVGAVAGAGLGAVVGGLSPVEGAVLGAAVGGVAGAVWADRDQDGRADGYYQNGSYYSGAPAGYAGNRCRNVAGGAATGAGVGAVGGAGLGAVVGGINPIEGAVIGALVGGLAGAVYTDANNDGCVDGYTQGGQYYPGAPQSQAPGSYQQPNYEAPRRSGERG